MKKLVCIVLLIVLGTTCSLGTAKSEDDSIKLQSTPENNSLISNGGFEDGLSGWNSLWTREPGTGKLSVDSGERYGGNSSVRIEHTGTKDWSFSPQNEIQVTSGELYELKSWVKLKGEGTGTLCVITYDSEGNVLDWLYASTLIKAASDWQCAKTRFVIPANVSKITPRWIGEDKAILWIDDFSINKKEIITKNNLSKKLKITNSMISVTLDTSNGTLSVYDKRTKKSWNQKPQWNDVLLTNAKINGESIEMTLYNIITDMELKVLLQLEKKLPEYTLTLSGSGKLPKPIRFPQPFVTGKGTYLVVPMNEGISYPVDDPTIDPMQLIAYGGHGISMAFWGVTDGNSGQMAIIETPDDASILIDRYDGKLCVTPGWESQKGQFGYTRKIRYVFMDRGGYVAMCKRYRAYAQEKGLLKTMEQKRKENPSVDKLVGAVNVWSWEADSVKYVSEMKALGINRILWSNAQTPDTLKKLNGMGVLTSRYDIYQDIMNPDNYKYIAYTHPDWPQGAWPKDIMIGSDGKWIKGWEIEGNSDAPQKWYPCGVVCDKQALKYAKQRITEELKTYPYQSRFIDTTTASPWRECYDPNHPMTRSESRYWKMKLLEYISKDSKMVTGSETGIDAAVPYLHYFEGMMSLGPYRVNDAGRYMDQILEDVPDQISKFQVGYKYRLPLWELVYHDSVVSYWYWGDYNNKIPGVWDKRDLINILYGTPPMFMFNDSVWNEYKARFAQSYKNTAPVARETGYSEMLDYKLLKPDRSVQQSVFANGITVTANFGDSPYKLSNGIVVPANGFYIKGLKQGILKGSYQ